jgi:hypothetical protein
MKNNKKIYMLAVLALFSCKQELSAMGSARHVVLAGLKKAAEQVAGYTPLEVLSTYKQQKKSIKHFKTQEQFLQASIPLFVRNKISTVFREKGIEVTCIYHSAGISTLPFLGIESVGSQALLIMNERAIEAFEDQNKEGYTSADMWAVVQHELGHAVYRHDEKKLLGKGSCSFIRCVSLPTFFYQNCETVNQLLTNTFEGHTEARWGIVAAVVGSIGTSKKAAVWWDSLLSRCYERQADNFVLRTSDAPTILAHRDFFEKIRRDMGDEYSWYTSLHPRLSERIAACDKALAELEAAKK